MGEFAGEKTEQPTPRRLEEAARRGQFARSPEVQTVFVLGGCLLLLSMFGREIWKNLATAMITILGHLYDMPLNQSNLQMLVIKAVLIYAACVAPILIGAVAFGLLAGGIQSKFQTAPEALEAKWERLNPFAGFKRIFSMRGAVSGGVALLKLIILVFIVVSTTKSIATDPFFHSTVDMARIADFMAKSAMQIGWRVVGALAVIAALDYAYQYWQTNKDLMMTREELKEEVKNTEGDPFVKAAQKRRRYAIAFRKMLEDVKKADVVVTNPTHFAVAMCYDRKTMKAPKIVAKGSRIKAQKIKEVAAQYQVPVLENKPLARMLFKYGKVGSEIPAQFYQAVAEILAFVYRINRFKYYAEQNQSQS